MMYNLGKDRLSAQVETRGITKATLAYLSRTAPEVFLPHSTPSSLGIVLV